MTLSLNHCPTGRANLWVSLETGCWLVQTVLFCEFYCSVLGISWLFWKFFATDLLPADGEWDVHALVHDIQPSHQHFYLSSLFLSSLSPCLYSHPCAFEPNAHNKKWFIALLIHLHVFNSNLFPAYFSSRLFIFLKHSEYHLSSFLHCHSWISLYSFKYALIYAPLPCQKGQFLEMWYVPTRWGQFIQWLREALKPFLRGMNSFWKMGLKGMMLYCTCQWHSL